MKKIISLILCALMLVSLFACGKSDADESSTETAAGTETAGAPDAKLEDAPVEGYTEGFIAALKAENEKFAELDNFEISFTAVMKEGWLGEDAPKDAAPAEGEKPVSVFCDYSVWPKDQKEKTVYTYGAYFFSLNTEKGTLTPVSAMTMVNDAEKGITDEQTFDSEELAEKIDFMYEFIK